MSQSGHNDVYSLTSKLVDELLTTKAKGGAGITSGLAAIGSVVGGGMSAIPALTVAAPAGATIAISYGAYKIWQYVTK